MGYNKPIALILSLLLLASLACGCQGAGAEELLQDSPGADELKGIRSGDGNPVDQDTGGEADIVDPPAEPEPDSQVPQVPQVPQTIAVNNIDLSPGTLSLAVGQSRKLLHKITPENASDKSVSWTSSNPKVAAVQGGEVTGVANGTAVITVKTPNGKSASATVTVFTPVSSVKLSASALTIPVKGTSQLTATVLPAGASNQSVAWTSSNSQIASVSSAGLVTGHKPGIAVITARSQDGGFTARVTISVCSLEELHMFEQVNQERAKAGLSPYKWNPELARIARIKSQDIIDNDYWSHTSPTYGNVNEMLNHFKVKWSRCGENLARFSCCIKAHEALMGSPAHEANILSPHFTEMGIGIIQNDNGRFFVTQLFLKP